MPTGNFREVLIRARWLVLGLAAFSCLGIGVYLSSYAGVLAVAKLEAFTISLVALGAGIWLSRSIRIAAIVAIVPFTTALLSVGILTPVAAAWPALCGVLVPHAIATVLLPVAGIAIVIAHDFAGGVCTGNAPDAAAWSAVARLRLPASLALLAAASWRALLLLPNRVLHIPSNVETTDVSVLAAGVSALVGALVCFLLLPLLLGAVRLSESAIANANRLGEVRERSVEWLGFLTSPRWALAMLGISIVLATILFFGNPRGVSPALSLWRGQGLLFPGTLLLVGLIEAVGLRNWRTLVVSAVTSGFAATVGGVAVLKLGAVTAIDLGGVVVIPGVTAPNALCATAALSAGLCYLLAARMGSFRTFDDSLDVAFARTISEVTYPVIAVGVALALALVPLHLWPLSIASALVALALVPALTASIEIVFPKLKSVEELYGKSDPA